MSALVEFAQRDRIHVTTDALRYTSAGVPVAIAAKSYVIGHWPAVFASVGASSLEMFLAPLLGQAFGSFDDFAERGDAELPRLVEDCRSFLAANGLPPTASEVVIAGVAKGGPRVLSFRTSDELPPGVTREQAETSPYWAKRPAQLVELPPEIMTPVPSDQVIPAGWEGFDAADSGDLVAWKMRKMLTMQRAQFPSIGGFGQLTTIYADRIEQRIICRWPDKLGEPLQPERIDWPAWHAANPKPGDGRQRATKLRVVS